MATKPRLVIFDDTDSRVKYSPQGWFQDNGSRDTLGNFGPTYRQTERGTVTNGTRFSFQFQGTGFKVCGTSDYVKSDQDTYDPALNCKVDGLSINSAVPQPGVNNQAFCEVQSLSDGPHNVSVVVTTSGRTFWFDYILYEPSITTNETSLQGKALVIDNAYPPINYNDGWTSFNQTVHLTQKKDSTMKFDFIGTGVTWYGLIPQGFSQQPTSGLFSIDGQPGRSFTISGNSTNQYNQPFFSANNLSTGSHSLTVTYQGDENHAPLTLDYLILEPNVGSSAPSPSSSQSSSPAHSSKPPIGAIVGGVVGGIALILTIIVLVWLLRKRRSSRGHEAQLDLDEEPPTLLTTNYTAQAGVITPFIQSNSVSQSDSYLATPAHPGSGMSESTSSTHRSYTQLSSSLGSPIESPPADSRLSRPSKTQQSQPSQPRERLVRHEDSGIRYNQDEEIIVDVPPSYTAN